MAIGAKKITLPITNESTGTVSNVEYSFVQVDNTLATAGAAADAKKTGDEINDLKQDLEGLDVYTLGLYPQMSVADTAVASFTDGADDIPVKSLTVDITPVQDLHGQANPYPAGGGKNKMPPRAEGTVTISGVTITTDSNGVITLNGTATEQVNPSLCTAFKGLPNASVIPSIGATGFNFWVNDVTAGTNPSVGSAFTADSTHEYRVFMTIPSGTTLNNQKIYPMIRLASESDATWEPYSNICPISGWAGANVSVTGINLWDEEWEVGAYNESTGEEMQDSTRIRSKNRIPVIPNTVYACRNRLSIYEYGEDGTYLRQIGFYGEADSYFLFECPSDCFSINFICTSTYGTTYNHDISINYPSTDHDYHAYKGHVYSISFPTSAGTVYGGTLDVTNGVLTVDRAFVSKAWGEWTTNGTLTNHIRKMIALSGNNKCGSDASSSGKKNCNMLAYLGNYTSDTPHFYVEETGIFAFLPTDTASDVVVQVSYPLLVTQTYQLTPTEVATILGQNNIFADTGNINELTYRADLKAYIDAHVGS